MSAKGRPRFGISHQGQHLTIGRGVNHEDSSVARPHHCQADGGAGSEEGGIIIPDSAKEKPQEGKVIAVGNGKVADDGKKIPLDVKAGDKILFGKYSGSEVKVEDEEYLILREEDVLAIIE